MATETENRERVPLQNDSIKTSSNLLPVLAIAELIGASPGTDKPLGVLLSGQMQSAIGFIDQISKMDFSTDSQLSETRAACDSLVLAMRAAPEGVVRDSLKALADRLTEVSNQMITDFRSRERKEARRRPYRGSRAAASPAFEHSAAACAAQ